MDVRWVLSRVRLRVLGVCGECCAGSVLCLCGGLIRQGIKGCCGCWGMQGVKVGYKGVLWAGFSVHSRSWLRGINRVFKVVRVRVIVRESDCDGARVGWLVEGVGLRDCLKAGA